VLHSSLPDDGGHLNADGQHLVKAALLKFLASYTGSH
jgi:lysophospholipase L1-like esterase